VVGAQQRGAGPLALPVWPDSEHGQVVVEDICWLTALKRLVEGQELGSPVDTPSRAA
jgi:hypothetical protein